jgi:hypothetical protein
MQQKQNENVMPEEVMLKYMDLMAKLESRTAPMQQQQATTPA